MLRPTVTRPRERLRAVLVAYQFPPTGGVSVARVLKLCKFLPEHQITPTVITASNPSAPLHDDALLGDARGVEVIRVPTLEPGYWLKRASWMAKAKGSSSPSFGRSLLSVGRAMLAPDPQVLWQPAAQRALRRRLARGADLVFISAPPFSQFLLGPAARRRPGTAVVLDYRDEWSTYRASFEMMGRLQSKIGDWLEPALIRSAHLITTATEAFRQELLRRFDFLAPEQVVAITNGYDPDDFPAEKPDPPKDHFLLTYAGTVFALNRSPGFLGAIRRLHRDEPRLARLLRVRFIGRIVETEQPSFEGMDRYGVEVVGFLPKERAMRELARSHMVMCMFDEVPGTERMYAAKIFELMYLGRPCLTLAPRGALTSLAERHALGPTAGPRDEVSIARILERALREFAAGTYEAETSPVDIDRFHRRAIAGQFARAFEEAVDHARR